MGDLVREDPPPNAAPERKPSAVYINLMRLALTPGEWGRVQSYEKKHIASQCARDLRYGRRKKPPGEWEFRHGAIPENPSRYGVWARLIPSEEQESGVTDESETDAGRVNQP